MNLTTMSIYVQPNGVMVTAQIISGSSSLNALTSLLHGCYFSLSSKHESSMNSMPITKDF